jgi:hypothetical protein
MKATARVSTTRRPRRGSRVLGFAQGLDPGVLFVPILVRRQLVAPQALGLSPLAAATGAPTARIERVPDMKAEAMPTILGLRLPSALRATDAPWVVAKAIVELG